MLPPKNKWDRKNRPTNLLEVSDFKKVLKSQKKIRDSDSFYDLAAFEKNSGELIGGVSLMDVLRGPWQSAYQGYAIFNQYWGHGFGKEAVLAMIDIGFRQIKVHRLEAGIERSNLRSIKLAKAIGLRKEGIKKRAILLQDNWVDLLVYAATSEEFGIRRKGEATFRSR